LNVKLGYIVLISAVCVVYRDITDRKQAEEATANLATAVEQAAEAIMIVGTDGAIKYLNHVFEQITGYWNAILIAAGCDFLF
jgi:PAS domain-containing protein